MAAPDVAARTAALSSTAAATTVGAPGDLPRPGGPGSPPRDARSSQVASYDPADFSMPTGREEDWRFTPLDRLHSLLDDVAPDASIELTWNSGVSVERVGRDDTRVGSALLPTDRVVAIALARTDKPLVVSVPKGARLDEPVVLTLRGTGGGTGSTAYDHIVIDVGALASATVVLEHVGSATYAGSVEVLVGDGASVTVVSVQDWAPDAVHVGAQAALLGRDATFRSVIVTLGGDLVRLLPTVRYGGPGGNAELLGLYFADAGQHLEHRLFVDHTAAQCRSRVNYRGALQGEDAHAVWIGDVLIRAEALGTDTYEVNRNLLLTDGARADSVPNLEIETGEVIGAGHASTTGRFDDEQLFYLMSRGIPQREARRLVVRGFFASVIAQIRLPELQDRLTAAVESELERVRHD